MRALIPRYSPRHLPLLRLQTRRGARYLVKTDIANFYHSIYTHSIPWAIETKPVAKANQSQSLLGNRLDKIVREQQDRQTVGIPIGPDTSLLLAESVLRAVDDELRSMVKPLRGFRYVDDFELAFPTLSAAEEALQAIEVCLAEYELMLNPRKTVLEDLPRPIDEPWKHELAQMEITAGRRESARLMGYFSRAVELAREHPDASVLKYAIARLREFAPSSSAAWQVLQGCLLTSASADGALLAIVFESLLRLRASWKVRRSSLGDVIEALVERHAPLGHASEVAWALCAAMAFDVKLQPSKPVVTRLSESEDNVVALLALDTDARGLLVGLDKSNWSTVMTTADLARENWLLAYEANVKGWLPGVGGIDHVAAAPLFSDLKSAGVSFYEPSFVTNSPAATAPIPGGALGIFYA